MPPSLLSPNTGNLYVGKGILTFIPEGSSDERDMGEVLEFEFTPTIENLDHFTNRSGTRSKDFVVVLERGGTARIVLEEWTPANLALALMGTVDELAVGGPEIEIFSEDAITGRVKFTGNNDVGPRWDIDLHSVRFIPSSSLNPISEEWGGIEVEGEVLLSATTGQFGIAKMTNLDAGS